MSQLIKVRLESPRNFSCPNVKLPGPSIVGTIHFKVCLLRIDKGSRAVRQVISAEPYIVQQQCIYNIKSHILYISI